MRKYIRAAVDNSTVVTVGGDWIDRFMTNSDTVSSLIVDHLSFNEDFLFLEDVEDYYDDYIQKFIDFGMKLIDGILYIPKDLLFNIRCFNSDNKELINIENGASIDWYAFYDIPVDITFTPLGYSCYWAADNSYKSFDEVVADILFYKEYFDIK